MDKWQSRGPEPLAVEAMKTSLTTATHDKGKRQIPQRLRQVWLQVEAQNQVFRPRHIRGCMARYMKRLFRGPPAVHWG